MDILMAVEQLPGSYIRDSKGAVWKKRNLRQFLTEQVKTTQAYRGRRFCIREGHVYEFGQGTESTNWLFAGSTMEAWANEHLLAPGVQQGAIQAIETYLRIVAIVPEHLPLVVAEYITRYCPGKAKLAIARIDRDQPSWLQNLNAAEAHHWLKQHVELS